MLPRSSRSYHPDVPSGDTVTKGKNFAGLSALSDLSHFMLFEDGSGTTFSTEIGTPTSNHSVPHVIGMCTQTKMAGIHAQTVIAFMQYEQPRRDGASVHFPCYSMSTLHFSPDGDAAVKTVTTSSCSSPVPTGSSFNDLRKEALTQLHARVLASAKGVA